MLEYKFFRVARSRVLDTAIHGQFLVHTLSQFLFRLIIHNSLAFFFKKSISVNSTALRISGYRSSIVEGCWVSKELLVRERVLNSCAWSKIRDLKIIRC
jgi:hypothetical protein